MMKGYEYQSDFAKKYVAQGRDEGRKEGLKEGERAMLLRMMRSRFGELPPAAVARTEGADVARIEQWADRLLSAHTLAEVLDDPA